MIKKIIIVFLFLIPFSLYSQNLDINILRSINSSRNLSSDNVFRTISNSDIYITTIIPSALLVTGLLNHNIKKTSISIESVIVTFGITELLKYSFNRVRPFNRYSDIRNKSGSLCSDPSFPSGHTSSAFAFATSVSLIYPKWYVIVPSYLYAGTVAYSRLHLGVHYPSDVFAGIVIGVGSSYLCYIVNKKLINK